MTLVYTLLVYTYPAVTSDSTVTWTVRIDNACDNTILDSIGAFATMTTSVKQPERLRLSQMLKILSVRQMMPQLQATQSPPTTHHLSPQDPSKVQFFVV